jgi:ribosomal protein L16 Arg81 hydroxylase
MDRQRLTFRDLIAPIGAGQFFEQYYRKQPLHVPGGDDRFAEVFSWRELNHLLSMTNIWSDLSLELSLDGRNLPAEDYCYSGLDRDNKKSDNPDFRRVFEHLRQGASLTLNFIERLTPALRAQSQTFAAVLCVPVNCSVFCSWQKTQGYASHFDTPQVFVCHIAGVKRWRIYEGRMATAAPIEGARSSNFPPEHHERAKNRFICRSSCVTSWRRTSSPCCRTTCPRIPCSGSTCRTSIPPPAPRITGAGSPSGYSRSW